MSCNLDHVLYNKNNLTDAEKEKYADKFQQMFIGKEERFIPYIKNLATKDMPKSHPGSSPATNLVFSSAWEIFDNKI